jgi:hypothetical protein
VYRISGLVKVRGMYVKLAPMRQMTEQLKKEKDVALKKVTALEQQMEAIITQIQVATLCTWE